MTAAETTVSQIYFTCFVAKVLPYIGAAVELITRTVDAYSNKDFTGHYLTIMHSMEALKLV